MKYKSKNLDFLSNDMKMSNLCYYNEHYYFQCDSEIAEAEIVSDEEFAEAVASVVVAEPIVFQPTQLDRIESLVSKSNEEIAQEARDAYTLELIEGGVIA